MKNIAWVITAIFILISCGRQGQAVDIRKAEYYEMVTEYENYYTTDSLLVKVTESDFSIVNGLRQPGRKRVSEYEYMDLPEGVTGRREYRFSDDNRRYLYMTKLKSDTFEEEIECNGKDTTHYRLVKYNDARQVTREINRSKMNVPQFDMATDESSDCEYFYDDKGRKWREITCRRFLDVEDKTETLYAYKGDTEELISEKRIDLLDGSGSTLEYETTHAGDTLIQKAYYNGKLNSMTKKTPIYFQFLLYTECKPNVLNEVITAGNIKTEISFDYEREATDTLRYENGLLIREVRISPTMKTVYNYSYDAKGNLLTNRQEAWFYEE